MLRFYVTIKGKGDQICFDLRYTSQGNEKENEGYSLEWRKENLYLKREYFDLLVMRKIFHLENETDSCYVTGPINRKVGVGMNVKSIGNAIHFDMVFAQKAYKLWENIEVTISDLRVSSYDYQEIVYRLRALSRYKYLGIVENIEEAIKYGENERIEFKRDFLYSKAKVVKAVVAFANSNNGNLFLGIGDEGQIYGIDHEIQRYKNEDKYLLAITSYLQEKIFPAMSPFPVMRIHQIEGRSVLHIFIEAGRELYTFYDDQGEKVVAVRTNNQSQVIKDPHKIGALYMERKG